MPRSVPGLVTRRLLVMDFLEGDQITRLAHRTRHLSHRSASLALAHNPAQPFQAPPTEKIWGLMVTVVVEPLSTFGRIKALHRWQAPGTSGLPSRQKRAAARRILERVSEAFGVMMLDKGLFQADAHPGNILVMKGGCLFNSAQGTASMHVRFL